MYIGLALYNILEGQYKSIFEIFKNIPSLKNQNEKFLKMKEIKLYKVHLFGVNYGYEYVRIFEK